MSVGFITEPQTIHAVETPLSCFKESHDHFICSKGKGLSFFGMQKSINTMPIFTMHSIKPICRDNYERLSKNQTSRKTDKRVLFHQDNAPIHKSLKPRTAVHDLFSWFGTIWLTWKKKKKKNHLTVYLLLITSLQFTHFFTMLGKGDYIEN